MTKSELFRKAHALAKSAVAVLGGDYRATFSESLRLLTSKDELVAQSARIKAADIIRSVSEHLTRAKNLAAAAELPTTDAATAANLRKRAASERALAQSAYAAHSYSLQFAA